MQPTPPPTPAKVNVVVWSGLDKLAARPAFAARRPAFAARRPAEEERATPPPVGMARPVAGPLARPAKRSL
jgi:hypothetical protein